MSFNQRKIGIIITYFTLAFNALMGIIYTPFMISKIGDGLYGIYALANSLISFITLLDLGFGQTLVRYISKARAIGDKEEEYKLNGLFLKSYSIIAIFALLIGIVIIVAYPNLTETTFTKNETEVFRKVFSILLINVVVSFPMSVFSATLNAYEEFLFLKLTSFIVSIINYSSMFYLLYTGYKLIPIVLATSITNILLQISYFMYAIRKLGIRFDFSKPEINLVEEILKFSFFIFLNLIIDFLYSNTDKLILGIVSGTVSVSIYSIGIYFSQYFTEMSTAMSSVFMPKIMSLYQNGKTDEISNVFNKVGRCQMILLFLVLGGYVSLGREFIELWVGANYKESYFIGLIILIPSIIPLTQNVGITILRAMNIHKYRSYMYMVIAVLNVIISVPLAMKYNGIGSAIGTSISTFLGQIVFMNCFYNYKVGLNMKEYWKNFICFLGWSVCVIIICNFIKRIIYINTWKTFGLFVAVFSLIYILGYIVFFANSYERKIIFDLLKKYVRYNRDE